jgi:CelD/BcsL family acetyltransferase involved in cellulose biosynthesis
MESEPAGRGDIRIIRDHADFLALREHWDDLFESSPVASAALRFEWLEQWWQVYGAAYGEPGSLAIITAWSDGRLIGALPLYRRIYGRFIRHARLQFLSTGEDEFEETCPEYMDVLVRHGQEELAVAAIREALCSKAGITWDDSLFMDVSENSLLLADWRAHTPAGCFVDIRPRGVSPVADLRGGFDAYLGRLSPNSRQQARRALRDAERAGTTLQFATTAPEVDASIEHLIELHQSRWRAAGKAGCFSAQRFTDFHRGLARMLVPRGAAVLASLAQGGRPLAAIYGFITRDKFDFYQSGVRVDGADGMGRPGITAHLLLMSSLAARGIAHYDFLRGSSEYKRRLATETRELFALHIARPRSAIWATTKRGKRLLRRVFGSWREGGSGRRFMQSFFSQACAILHSGTVMMASVV